MHPGAMMAGGDAMGRVIAALDFVEERATLPIRVGDMADAACCSLFHFIRIFNAATWHSPYDYAMKRKISLSSSRVLDDGESLLDIALDLGFESSEGFSRAFRRVFGINPSEARRSGTVDPRKFIPVPDKRMLGILSRCRPAGKSVFRGGFSPDVRIIAAESVAEGIERAVEGRDAAWIGVVHSQEDAGESQVLAGPGGPFVTDLGSGSWYEVVHKGPPSDLPAMPGLVDFAFRAALGLDVPPDRIVLRRDGAETRILLNDRSCG